MASEGRVRISLATGELEIEGTSDFVKQYDEAIIGMLERLASEPIARPNGGKSTGHLVVSDSQEDGSESDGASPGPAGRLELGEALHALPKNSAGTDKILVAALYAQRANHENEFTTLNANKLLIEQGVKLTNAAQCIKQNVSAKRVFKVKGNRWRISKDGMERLASLGIS